MLKKLLPTAVVVLMTTSLLVASGAQAATIKNGVACAKAGASSTVKVGTVAKTYICKINPAVVGSTKTTWTLKTCISYWASAKNSQDSIDQQNSLIQAMSEPDKTTNTNQLKASQDALNQVKAQILANHCKAGL